MIHQDRSKLDMHTRVSVSSTLGSLACEGGVILLWQYKFIISFVYIVQF